MAGASNHPVAMGGQVEGRYSSMNVPGCHIGVSLESTSPMHSNMVHTNSHMKTYSNSNESNTSDITLSVSNTMNTSNSSTSTSASASASNNVSTMSHLTFRCPLCDKVFTNSSAVAKHKLTHSDERKYICNICNKAFKRQDHLSGHKLTHELRKPHACRLCDKSFTDSRSLRRHYENQHLDHHSQLRLTSLVQSDGNALRNGTSGTVELREGEFVNLDVLIDPLNEPKSFYCSVCGKGFKNQAALNGHMRLHGGYGLTTMQYVSETSSSSSSTQPVPQSSGREVHQQSSNQECTTISTCKASPSSKLSSEMKSDHNCGDSKFPSFSTNPMFPNDPGGPFLAPMCDRSIAHYTPSSSSSTDHSQYHNSHHHSHHHHHSAPPLPSFYRNMKFEATLPSHLSALPQSKVPHVDIHETYQKDMLISHPLAKLHYALTNDLEDPHPISQSCHSATSSSFPTMNSANCSAFSIETVTRSNQQHYSPITPVDCGPDLSQSTINQYARNTGSHFSFDPAHLHQLACTTSSSAMSRNDESYLPFACDQDVIMPPISSFIATTSLPLERKETSFNRPSRMDYSLEYIDDFLKTENSIKTSPFVTSDTLSTWAFSMGSNFDKTLDLFSSNVAVDEYSKPLQMDTCGSYVFRNPLPAPKKVKRKPAPLHIPPQMNASVSRLRSPRLFGLPPWGGESGTLVGNNGEVGASSYSSHYSNLASPKYTPPPMLSPQRKGPGLFVSLARYPLTPKLQSSSNASHPLQADWKPSYGSGSVRENVFGYDEQSLQSCTAACSESILSPGEVNEASQLQVECTANTPSSLDVETVEDDILEDGLPCSAFPAINIGSPFQADLPEYCPHHSVALEDCNEYETLLWDPKAILGDQEKEKSLDLLMKIACSPAIKECGLNLEYAIHLVHKFNGDLELALRGLLHESFTVLDYIYAETTQWNTEEVICFQQNIRTHDRDFNKVSQALCSKGMQKSVKACVEFYYMWKRMNTSNEVQYYRTHQSTRSTLNHKKRTTSEHQTGNGTCEETVDSSLNPQTRLSFVEPCDQIEAGYNLRKKATESTPVKSVCNGDGLAASSQYSEVQQQNSSLVTTFPCEICGKEFKKVKSRNAHMKWHKEKV